MNLDGNHSPGRTDMDVTAVSFFHGRMEVAFPEIVLDRFPRLHTIIVTGNINVQRFAIQRCTRLTFFSFEGPANAITRLNNGMFRDCRFMEEIRVQRTVVTTIEEDIFQDTPNLRRLLIPRNSIQSLAIGTFRNLNNLEHLDIERNSIVTFHPQIFQGLVSLRHVQCGQLNNRIWPTGLFSNLPSLFEININFSGLQTIEPSVFGALPSLEVLRIYGEIRHLSSNIFAEPLPRVRTFNIGTNLLEALERGFFNNLPAVRNVYASRNLCVNQNFLDIVDMQPVLEGFETCFRNFWTA